MFLGAESEPSPPAPAARPRPPGSDTIEPLGPSLFPIYEHYHRGKDNTDVKTVFFLYHSTDRLDGQGKSRLLLPFFFWERQIEPPDYRLYLFPFLYFHRSSPEESYDYSIPFYFRNRTPTGAYRVLFPFLWESEDPRTGITTDRVLFPLWKLTRDLSRPSQPEKRIRFGIKYLLELFEAKFGEKLTRLRAFNFFNFRGETESGISLFGHERIVAPDGVAEERSWLFPFFQRSDTLDGKSFQLFPFYGSFAHGGVVKNYYTPLVWRGQGDGGFRSLALFPFYHRITQERPEYSYFASYPFFDWMRNPQERNWGILFFLFRANHQYETGKNAYSVLWPLGRFEVEPDGMKGHRRMLPFYYEDWNESRNLRFGIPIYWNYQELSQGEWEWDFTLCLPTYIGWGARHDYFATGFPLYWSVRSGASGWDLFIPFFFRDFDRTSSAFYSLPLVLVRYPSQVTVAPLAGAVSYRRFYDSGTPVGWAANALWWLWGVKETPNEGDLRLLPLFMSLRRGEDRSILIFPFLFLQKGPTQSQAYFFPVYGKFRSSDGRLKQDFYALGTYAHTTEYDDQGAPFRTTNDILWSLISFQENSKTGYSHQRVLPLGFWRTRSVNADRTIQVPFYYSHRIQEEDRTYFLSMFLGNLFLSRRVERDLPPTLAPPPEPAAPAAAGPPEPSTSSASSSSPGPSPKPDPARSLAPAPPGAPSSPPLPAGGPSVAPIPIPRIVESYERGVLWPISDFGRDSKGNPFEWVLPFYHHSQTPTEEKRSFFPFLYTTTQTGPYQVGYFRYFFLLDWERFEAGYRFSIGQLLFDWMSDGLKSEKRLRLLYPIIENRWSPDGYKYQITPLWQGEKSERGGERKTNHFIFPVFWVGKTQLQNPEGGYTTDQSHFFIFPLYGVSKKSLRTEHDVLFPFVHYQRSLDGFAFQLRPFFFLRRDAGESSMYLWPIHAGESGEGAGEWWVSKYLYISKLFRKRQGFRYRLDPFLFWASDSVPESRVGGLFGLVDHHRFTDPEDTEETRWRVLPLAYGYSRPTDSAAAVFPLSFARDFGAREIDYLVPWRFFFVLNWLRGAGDRHFSLLWKLAEYTDRPGQARFHDFRILQGLVVDRRTESARQLAFQPLFDYLRNDDEKELEWSILFSVFQHKEKWGVSRNTLFWIFRW
jgi:hypothetical protein